MCKWSRVSYGASRHLPPPPRWPPLNTHTELACTPLQPGYWLPGSDPVPVTSQLKLYRCLTPLACALVLDSADLATAASNTTHAHRVLESESGTIAKHAHTHVSAAHPSRPLAAESSAISSVQVRSECRDGHTGPVCAVCQPGYERAWDDGGCQQCAAPAVAWAYTSVIILSTTQLQQAPVSACTLTTLLNHTPTQCR